MLFRDMVYTLREVTSPYCTRYFISFKDGQEVFHNIEVSEELYIEFRKLERINRNLQQFNERHSEYSELTETTLNRRALRLPQNVDELIIEEEQAELLHKTIAVLPEIQRRRFLLYHEYDLNYYQIGAMEYCTPQAVRRSVIIAREKVKAQMKQYLCA
ncbi:RNA polymerase sigma-70 factor, ECF subfamily [Eubacterium maltosivorans]|uniref:RNA polymerase sigma factor n=1 Tax=Eubacterium maltosivorans TaxID=2041044 RepID=UPI00088AB320|nr:RNA polymerase [Eubacterium maltosivorans]WPK79388.1 hypothetical protein EUMA32_07950 [Eubacterium maltosivorans]SDP42239.1 RNA polymerase sigma-70 factor, ECF subfamily [Eubacterium maltosivorans]